MITQRDDFSKVQFAAILVFHDSREWGRDTQIIIDILRSHNGVFGTEHPPSEPLPTSRSPSTFPTATCVSLLLASHTFSPCPLSDRISGVRILRSVGQ